MAKPIIGIDVDGVLADQIAPIIPIVKERYGIDLKHEDVTEHDIPVGNTTIGKIIVGSQMEYKNIINMPPIKNAPEVVRKLRKDYQIYIITARPDYIYFETQDWLNKNKIPYDYFSRIDGEQKYILQPAIMIEDYIPNLLPCLLKTNMKCILFSRPWNHDIIKVKKFIENGRLKIVKNWLEIPDVIETLIGG